MKIYIAMDDDLDDWCRSVGYFLDKFKAEECCAYLNRTESGWWRVSEYDLDETDYASLNKKLDEQGIEKDEDMEEYTNEKVVGMRFIAWADFRTPIDITEFRKLEDDFMVKIDKIHFNVFNGCCKKGHRGMFIPIYEGEEEL